MDIGQNMAVEYAPKHKPYTGDKGKMPIYFTVFVFRFKLIYHQHLGYYVFLICLCVIYRTSTVQKYLKQEVVRKWFGKCVSGGVLISDFVVLLFLV